MILINENRLRQIIREAVAVAAGEEALKGLGFADLEKGLAIAKKMANGKPMGFIRDAGDLYAYAAIGGNLEVGPSYAPAMFVVIHDGARPDRKSLGAVFKPDDPPPNANQFFPDTSGSDESQQAATALVAEYSGKNSYDFLVRNVKSGVILAGTASAVVAAPPVPEGIVAPAAPASDVLAAAAIAKNPTFLEKLFKRRRERKAPGSGAPEKQPARPNQAAGGMSRRKPVEDTAAELGEPGVRARAIASRIWSQLTAGSGIQVSIGEGKPFLDTLAAQIKRAIMRVTSKEARDWFSRSPREVLPDALVKAMSTDAVDKFLKSKNINNSEIKNVYAMMVDAYDSTQASIEANKEYTDKLSHRSFREMGKR